MILYQANTDWFNLFGRYTDSIEDLSIWASQNVLWGNCTAPVVVDVSVDGQAFTGYVANTEHTRKAMIRNDRYLTVVSL